ncbi:hypothetical protein Vafri_17155 [Volvox africanus]|uniref:Zinc finger protein n=1 Tax=Volvox africanus TaxID=51714 RepID=A0A8J4BKB8_9CHLO|nr:hypothetical protein Vafri_17155 [Volvox africanus]
MGSPVQVEELGQVLDVGDHCSVDHCRQLDFLPFRCDGCNRIFCLEHRSYVAHSCPNACAKETTVIVCPICAKSVHLKPGQEPNEAFDVHQRTDCDPTNYDKVHKKPRCPVGGCKEKLTTINAYRCKHCSQRVCLRHRDPGDHKCAEAQADLRQERMSNYALFAKPSSGRRAPASTTPTIAGPPAAALPPQSVPRRLDAQKLHAAAVKQYEDPANSVRGTAARRQQLAQQTGAQQQSAFQWPWQQQKLAAPPSTAPNAPPNIINSNSNSNGNGITTNQRNANSNSNANPLVPPHLPEQCPQCGASFATVERLVQHVEDFHPSAPVASSSALSGAHADGAAAEGPPASTGAATFFTNPLRGALGSTTIAGGEAPMVAATATAIAATPQLGLLYSGAGGRSPGGDGTSEVYRCYFCAQTFNDPVLLVRHSDRCAAANGGAAAAVAVRPGGRGDGAGSAGSSSKDNCAIC